MFVKNFNIHLYKSLLCTAIHSVSCLNLVTLNIMKTSVELSDCQAFSKETNSPFSQVGLKFLRISTKPLSCNCNEMPSLTFVITGGYPENPGPSPAKPYGLSRKDCATFPGFDHALCFAFRTDNSGPPMDYKASILLSNL